MRSLACLNGTIGPPEEAKVSIWDRGFLFGDAVYEVYRVHRGRLWLEAEHHARLERSLAAIQINNVNLDVSMDRVRETLRQSEIAEGTVYLQITRGVAPRRHAFPDPPVTPTELIVVRPYDDAEAAELRERGCGAITRPDIRWGRCDIKSTNLLANVLAQEEARRAGCYETIFVDRDGRVTEAAHTSLIWARDGRLEGTPESWAILPGTTRHWVIRLADRAGLSFREETIALEDLLGREEVIFLNTTSEVLPVVTIDSRPIGSGEPGPVARKLQAAYAAELAAWLDGAVS